MGDDILPLMKAADANAIVGEVGDWALRREDIRAMALVGSWARGDPHQDSDVDLLLISDRADEYRDRQEWLAQIDFESAGYGIVSTKDASYGLVWSCHVAILPAGMLELTFAQSSWARDLIDVETRRIVKDAFQIIFDKDEMLTKLVLVVMTE